MNHVTLTEVGSNGFNQWVLTAPRRQALPIAVYPGVAMTGATVQEIVTKPEAQVAAQLALHARYKTPALLSAMDLSAEAEAFGCTVHMSATEVPSVTGRLITSMQAARELAVPEAGAGRTGVYLETVRRLRAASDGRLVLGGCIGPFSLAARLVGVSEAMELTLAEPELMEVLLEKSAAFLTAYLQAFKAAGADGAIMAEPAAGLLSPRMMAAFSSNFIRQIGEAVGDGRFALVLHNCAARALHLPAVLQTGLKTFHFGAPMDLPAALAQVPPEVVVCGNLDPTGVFVQSTPTEMAQRVAQVLSALAGHRNFVISSGCDVPPNAPLANLDAFYAAVETAG
ncbi:MAG TPA: uroporphyrinogen decarboxylase family protein [Verrucomicrobiota bacterium]|nr:uroporphyrinogen decarboxylase family protein [Verrucomicrobiota bacterium]